MDNKNELKPWYSSREKLQQILSPDHCVIGRWDNSFGVLVFSGQLPEVQAETELEKVRNSHSIELGFHIFRSSVCSNCCQRQITDSTNLCSQCKNLFDQAQKEGKKYAA